jgi:hypothetical protein
MTLHCEILTTLCRASEVEMPGMQRGLLKIALETFEHHGVSIAKMTREHGSKALGQG